MEVSLPGR